MHGPGTRARFGFGPDRRLTRRDGFDSLLRSGVRRNIGGYTFYFSARQAGPARLGIMVTRKHSPRATERNAIKRCIREAFRQEHPGLGSLDVVVRPPFGVRASAAMILRLRHAFAGLRA